MNSHSHHTDSKQGRWGCGLASKITKQDIRFSSYLSTSTQKVLVLEYEYTSTITSSLLDADTNIYKSNSFLHLPNTF